MAQKKLKKKDKDKDSEDEPIDLLGEYGGETLGDSYDAADAKDDALSQEEDGDTGYEEKIDDVPDLDLDAAQFRGKKGQAGTRRK